MCPVAAVHTMAVAAKYGEDRRRGCVAAGQDSVASVAVTAVVVSPIVITSVAGCLYIAFIAAVIGLEVVGLIVLLVRFLLVCLDVVRVVTGCDSLAFDGV